MKQWRTPITRHWSAGLILFTAVLIILGAARLAADLGRPFGGYLTFYNVRSGRLSRDAQTPPWWPGMVAGLRQSASLLEIEGRRYTDHESDAFAAAAARGDHAVTLLIRQDGEEHTVTAPVLPFSFAHFVELTLPGLLVSLGLLVLAGVIYRAQPTGDLNQAAIALFCAISIYIGLMRPSLFWHDGVLSKGLDLAMIGFAPFTGVLLIHFALLFPQTNRSLPGSVRLALFLCYGLALTLALFHISSRFVLWEIGRNEWVKWLDKRAYRGAWQLLVIGASVLGMRFLWLLFSPKSRPRERRETAVLLVGLGVVLPVITFLVQSTLQERNTFPYFWHYLDLRYTYLAIPTVITAILLRYQTFQYAPPALLFVPVLAISGLVAAVGAAFVHSAYLPPGAAYVIPPLLPLFLITFFVSALWSSQASWQGWFGRLLHWEQHSYTAVRRLGQALLPQRRLDDVTRTLAHTLQAEFNLERVAVWLWREEEAGFHLAARSGSWAAPPPPQLPVSAAAPILAAPLRLRAAETAVPPPFIPLQHCELALLAPLTASNQPVGLLAIGPRRDQAVLNARDVEIIELIGQQAALFLLTAVQIAQLQQVPHQINRAQERERDKIAQELHDTIQQFLGRLPFLLEVSRESIHGNPQEADALLRRCLNDVEQAARTVRRIRHNLIPPEITGDFNQAIAKLSERFQRRQQIPVTLTFRPYPEERLTPEARHALYRIIQQALDNIAAHAQAQQAAITLQQDDGRFHFSIVDDGVGFNDAQRKEAEANGSFGLQSMTARLHAVGGDLTIHSQPAQGTRIIGRLPI